MTADQLLQRFQAQTIASPYYVSKPQQQATRGWEDCVLDIPPGKSGEGQWVYIDGSVMYVLTLTQDMLEYIKWEAARRGVTPLDIYREEQAAEVAMAARAPQITADWLAHCYSNSSHGQGYPPMQ